jgi:hypothetical protein
MQGKWNGWCSELLGEFGMWQFGFIEDLTKVVWRNVGTVRREGMFLKHDVQSFAMRLYCTFQEMCVCVCVCLTVEVRCTGSKGTCQATRIVGLWRVEVIL